MATRTTTALPPLPAEIARLQAALDEVDTLRARLAAAEVEQPVVVARAKATAEAAESAATAMVMGRMSDDEAARAERAAAEAEQVARRHDRLVRGLRTAVCDAESMAATLADGANVALREWAFAKAQALDVEYARAANALLDVLRRLTALAGASGLDHISAIDSPFIRIPASILDPSGRTLRVGGGSGDHVPLPTPASELAGEMLFLVERARRLAEKADVRAA